MFKIQKKDYLYDISVIGGCSLDMIYKQDTNNVYPNSPTDITPGGKGANQAIASARAGAKVCYIGKISHDEVGKIIYKNLKENNVDVSHVECVDNIENDTCKVFVSKEGENKIFRSEKIISSFTQELIEKNAEVLKRSKVVIAQLKAPKEFSIALINFCYENQIPLVLTPCKPEKLKADNQENLDLINKITIITANREECQTIFEGTVCDAVTLYPNKLFVTIGNKGLIYHNGKELKKEPAIQAGKKIDSTGAGDTFCGYLTAMLIKGYDIEKSTTLAQIASSIKITSLSAQAGIPFLKEVMKVYNKIHS